MEWVLKYLPTYVKYVRIERDRLTTYNRVFAFAVVVVVVLVVVNVTWMAIPCVKTRSTSCLLNVSIIIIINRGDCD